MAELFSYPATQYRVTKEVQHSLYDALCYACPSATPQIQRGHTIDTTDRHFLEIRTKADATVILQACGNLILLSETVSITRAAKSLSEKICQDFGCEPPSPEPPRQTSSSILEDAILLTLRNSSGHLNWTQLLEQTQHTYAQIPEQVRTAHPHCTSYEAFKLAVSHLVHAGLVNRSVWATRHQYTLSDKGKLASNFSGLLPTG